MSNFISASCKGEKCRCGQPAVKKVSEEIMHDDPIQLRHPYTQYVCQKHFDEALRPYLNKDELAIDDYKEALEDKKRLTKEIDIIINGDNAAEQASLCDLVGQIKELVKIRDTNSPNTKPSVNRIRNFQDLPIDFKCEIDHELSRRSFNFNSNIYDWCKETAIASYNFLKKGSAK